jgi:Uma2 family endonuclease
MIKTAPRKRIIRSVRKERSGPITFDEFCIMVHDGEKADLLDGVIYMASPDNTDSGDLQSWLQAVLYEFIRIHDLGKLFTSRIAFRLNDANTPEPDIAFVSGKAVDRIHRGYVEGPPDLAIELVSPDSVTRDYEKKFALYEKAGVKEYWIIDVDEQQATFLIRKGNKFERGNPIRNIWTSKVLSGLELDVRWLWMMQRPSVYEVLRSFYPVKP